MKVIYPIVITKTDDTDTPYFISIPDIDGMTQGKTIDNSIEMARDYIGLKVMDLQDSNEPVPSSNYELPKSKETDVVTLVDVDIDSYRKKHDTKLIKKTLTIPNYLNMLGKENGVNFSEILTDALKSKLNA
ncbi:type II toxin-antitoxin system HicB family antitoxin [Companilactobacillus muriivasis]|uniref:type II toxin-antitoxin system HicB family antitoxin n=1 Tax=Companilactobacillus muriivasis TaxID=3081444 RepID=UPI0030C663FB